MPHRDTLDGMGESPLLAGWKSCPRCGHELEREERSVHCPNCRLAVYANPAPTARALVLDTTSGKESASFEIVGDTDDLFYDGARQRVYVSGGDGFIDVVEDQGGNRFTRIGHVATSAGARTSLFVAEQGRLYLAVPHRGNQRAEVRVYDVH